MRSKLQFILFLFAAVSLSAQTSGNFDLSHNVIAGGGGQSTASGIRLDGTVGQPSAGTVSTGGSFSVRGGFWSMAPPVPTAATASISGRIMAANLRGISGVSVTLIDPETGESITTMTNTFGFYNFTDRSVGQTYIIRVFIKRYSFDPASQIIALEDDLTGVDFIAVP